MKVELNGDLGWEWFQVVWRGQLGDELAWIGDIDLFPEQPRAQVQVETAFEVLSNQLLVAGDLA